MEPEITSLPQNPEDDEPCGIQKPRPENRVPVLILWKGQWRIGQIEWEHPTWEDTYKSFPYWLDPFDDCADIQWEDVTDWQPLPPLP